MEPTHDILFTPPGDEHFVAAWPEDRHPWIINVSHALMVVSTGGILTCGVILACNHA